MRTITKQILAPLLASAVIGSAVSAEVLSCAHFVPPAHIITSFIVEPLSTAVAAASVGEALSASGEAGWNTRAIETIAMLRADLSKTVFELIADEAAAFNVLTLAVTDKVVAELDGQGRPPLAVKVAMIGK